jgi:hypothetical protein
MPVVWGVPVAKMFATVLADCVDRFTGYPSGLCINNVMVVVSIIQCVLFIINLVALF